MQKSSALTAPMTLSNGVTILGLGYGPDKLITLMQMVNELLKQAKTAKAVVNS